MKRVSPIHGAAACGALIALALLSQVLQAAEAGASPEAAAEGQVGPADNR